MSKQGSIQATPGKRLDNSKPKSAADKMLESVGNKHPSTSSKNQNDAIAGQKRGSTSAVVFATPRDSDVHVHTMATVGSSAVERTGQPLDHPAPTRRTGEKSSKPHDSSNKSATKTAEDNDKQGKTVEQEFCHTHGRAIPQRSLSPTDFTIVQPLRQLTNTSSCSTTTNSGQSSASAEKSGERKKQKENVEPNQQEKRANRREKARSRIQSPRPQRSAKLNSTALCEDTEKAKVVESESSVSAKERRKQKKSAEPGKQKKRGSGGKKPSSMDQSLTEEEKNASATVDGTPLCEDTEVMDCELVGSPGKTTLKGGTSAEPKNVENLPSTSKSKQKAKGGKSISTEEGGLKKTVEPAGTPTTFEKRLARQSAKKNASPSPIPSENAFDELIGTLHSRGRTYNTASKKLPKSTLNSPRGPRKSKSPVLQKVIAEPSEVPPSPDLGSKVSSFSSYVESDDGDSPTKSEQIKKASEVAVDVGKSTDRKSDQTPGRQCKKPTIKSNARKELKICNNNKPPADLRFDQVPVISPPSPDQGSQLPSFSNLTRRRSLLPQDDDIARLLLDWEDVSSSEKETNERQQSAVHQEDDRYFHETRQTSTEERGPCSVVSGKAFNDSIPTLPSRSTYCYGSTPTAIKKSKPDNQAKSPLKTSVVAVDTGKSSETKSDQTPRRPTEKRPVQTRAKTPCLQSNERAAEPISNALDTSDSVFDELLRTPHFQGVHSHENTLTSKEKSGSNTTAKVAKHKPSDDPQRIRPEKSFFRKSASSVVSTFASSGESDKASRFGERPVPAKPMTPCFQSTSKASETVFTIPSEREFDRLLPSPCPRRENAPITKPNSNRQAGLTVYKRSSAVERVAPEFAVSQKHGSPVSTSLKRRRSLLPEEDNDTSLQVLDWGDESSSGEEPKQRHRKLAPPKDGSHYYCENARKKRRFGEPLRKEGADIPRFLSIPSDPESEGINLQAFLKQRERDKKEWSAYEKKQAQEKLRIERTSKSITTSLRRPQKGKPPKKPRLSKEKAIEASIRFGAADPPELQMFPDHDTLTGGADTSVFDYNSQNSQHTDELFPFFKRYTEKLNAKISTSVEGTRVFPDPPLCTYKRTTPFRRQRNGESPSSRSLISAPKDQLANELQPVRSPFAQRANFLLFRKSGRPEKNKAAQPTGVVKRRYAKRTSKATPRVAQKGAIPKKSSSKFGSKFYHAIAVETNMDQNRNRNVGTKTVSRNPQNLITSGQSGFSPEIRQRHCIPEDPQGQSENLSRSIPPTSSGTTGYAESHQSTRHLGEQTDSILCGGMERRIDRTNVFQAAKNL